MLDFKKENEKFLQKNKELFEPYTDCLISKEKILLMLSELLEVANKEGFSVVDTIDYAYEWVKDMSTTYDINKVVEELKNEIDCDDHCSYKGAYCSSGRCRWRIVDDVIEIVKAGVNNE